LSHFETEPASRFVTHVTLVSRLVSRLATGRKTAPAGPIFIVCLQAQKGVEPIRALRGALKTLKRRYGLRCVTIREARRRRR
jgi:hypothetical protein